MKWNEDMSLCVSVTLYMIQTAIHGWGSYRETILCCEKVIFSCHNAHKHTNMNIYIYVWDSFEYTCQV